jgi:hypothetical protein
MQLFLPDWIAIWKRESYEHMNRPSSPKAHGFETVGTDTEPKGTLIDPAEGADAHWLLTSAIGLNGHGGLTTSTRTPKAFRGLSAERVASYDTAHE